MSEKRFNKCNPLRYSNCDKCKMWQFLKCIHYGYGTLPKSTEIQLDKMIFE